MVKVTGGHDTRVSLAALIAVRPGRRSRMIYRTRRPGGQRKGFTEKDYARLLDDAHQQLGGPLVVVWDNLNTHVSGKMASLVAARPWLTVFRLPSYAHDPVEGIWSLLKRAIANFAAADLAGLVRIVKRKLKKIQYRPHLVNGCLAGTGMTIEPW